jgi:hypothetical protein
MATDSNPKAKHFDPTHSLFKDGAELYNKKAPHGSQKEQGDLSGVAILSTIGVVVEPQPIKKPNFWKQLFSRKKSGLTTSIIQYTERVEDLCKVSETQLFPLSVSALASIIPEDWSDANIQRVREIARRYLANERNAMNIRLLATNLVGFQRVREERKDLAPHRRFPIRLIELSTTVNLPEMD